MRLGESPLLVEMGSLAAWLVFAARGERFTTARVPSNPRTTLCYTEKVRSQFLSLRQTWTVSHSDRSTVSKIPGTVLEIAAGILRGAKPSEIPFYQAGRFELVE